MTRKRARLLGLGGIALAVLVVVVLILPSQRHLGSQIKTQVSTLYTLDAAPDNGDIPQEKPVGPVGEEKCDDPFCGGGA